MSCEQIPWEELDKYKDFNVTSVPLMAIADHLGQVTTTLQLLQNIRDGSIQFVTSHCHMLHFSQPFCAKGTVRFSDRRGLVVINRMYVRCRLTMEVYFLKTCHFRGRLVHISLGELST